MGAARGELEVLVPLGQGGGDEEAGKGAPPGHRPSRDASPGSRSRRCRWPAVVVAVVVVSVAVGAPLRNWLARDQLRWLQGQWAHALADDGERITAEQQLNQYDGLADQAQIDVALAAMYREEQGRLTATRDRIRGGLLVDVGLATVRTDIEAALKHRAALLATVVAWYAHRTDGSPPAIADNQTAAETNRVDNALRAQRTRWGDHQPQPNALAVHYSSVTSALAHLSRWLDQPTGAVLLSGSRSGSPVLRLDVDASGVVRTAIPSIEGYPTLRQGYLAYASGNQIWAVAPDGSGPPRPLASGAFVFAANDPRDVWAVDGTTLQATEVDGTGRVVQGPLSPPGSLFMDTPAGLVVSSQDRPGIEIWNPRDGKLRCNSLLNTGDGGPYVLASTGNLLAWAGGDGRLHFTDVTTCRDRLPGLGNINVTGGYAAVGAFSPDGRTLAVAVSPAATQGNGTFALELVDVATGQSRQVPGTDAFFVPVNAIAWTPDGTRLFWVYGGSASSSIIVTWRVGDPSVRPLRAVGLALTFPLLVVP